MVPPKRSAAKGARVWVKNKQELRSTIDTILALDHSLAGKSDWPRISCDIDKFLQTESRVILWVAKQMGPDKTVQSN